MTNVTNKQFNPIEFPKPTMVSVNGVELEVFEAGKQNKGNPIVLCHGLILQEQKNHLASPY